jgi:hypothetical protein
VGKVIFSANKATLIMDELTRREAELIRSMYRLARKDPAFYPDDAEEREQFDDELDKLFEKLNVQDGNRCAPHRLPLARRS